MDNVLGDKIEAKQDKVLIGLVNLGGIPTERYREKDDRLREIMKSYGFDVFRITEVNVNWGHTRTYSLIWERTFGWFRDLRISTSWNSKYKHPGAFIRGGTMMMVAGKMAGRTKESKVGSLRLGQWSEILL